MSEENEMPEGSHEESNHSKANEKSAHGSGTSPTRKVALAIIGIIILTIIFAILMSKGKFP